MKDWWQQLNSRERALLTGGTALLVVLLLYVLLWEPFRASGQRLRQAVAEQRAELAWMRQSVQELQQLGSNATTQASAGRSLLTVVDQTARAAGLGASLKRLVPQGDDQISVQLDAVAFNALLNWLLKLEREQRLTLINLNVDRTGSPGLVNVRIILQGSAQP